MCEGVKLWLQSFLTPALHYQAAVVTWGEPSVLTGFEVGRARQPVCT